MKGIGEQKAARIYAAAKQLVPMRMVSAAEMLQLRRNMARTPESRPISFIIRFEL